MNTFTEGVVELKESCCDGEKYHNQETTLKSIWFDFSGTLHNRLNEQDTQDKLSVYIKVTQNSLTNFADKIYGLYNDILPCKDNCRQEIKGFLYEIGIEATRILEQLSISFPDHFDKFASFPQWGVFDNKILIPQLKHIVHGLEEKGIDAAAGTINIALDIPSANPTFSGKERTNVKLNRLWPYFNISTAATVKGINGTANPGNVTDCTKPLQYEVTAADGQKKVWKINIAPLPILPPVNNYEGNYTSNGYFYHPSSPRATPNVVKTMVTSGTNGVLVDLGDLGGSGYRALITINPDNTLTITGAPGAAGTPYLMFTSGLPDSYTAAWTGSASCNNTYDPATKTFKVRYGYGAAGAYRVTEEVLVRN